MNTHLEAVRAFHNALSYPQAEPAKTLQLSDMEIIKYQALLMEAGGEVLKAVKAGEMVEILIGLVDLAYIALAAIAMQGGEVVDKPIFWQQDGFVLSVMQIISAKINQCNTGESTHYAEVYCLCIHLARGFVNADFNKAFQMLHAHSMNRIKMGQGSIYEDSESIRKLKLQKNPDLSECLYE